MEQIRNQVGLRIREARESQGLSQRDLAERLHVSQTTVVSWERSTRVPGVDDLGRLGVALGKPPAWFLGPQALGYSGEPAGRGFEHAALGAYLAEVVTQALGRYEPTPAQLRATYPQLSEERARLMHWVEKAAPDLFDGKDSIVLTDETVGRLAELLHMWAASVRA